MEVPRIRMRVMVELISEMEVKILMFQGIWRGEAEDSTSLMLGDDRRPVSLAVSSWVNDSLGHVERSGVISSAAGDDIRSATLSSAMVAIGYIKVLILVLLRESWGLKGALLLITLWSIV
jgi:hypothetical protein